MLSWVIAENIGDIFFETQSRMNDSFKHCAQKFSDNRVRQVVEESKLDAFRRTQFLAASAPDSRDWLLVLPIASCGLRLDDEAIRVAV